MSESAPTPHTAVLVQLNWTGFKIWKDFCREQYRLSLRKNWSPATIERWFTPRFERLFKSRLRPDRYYEFSPEEFEQIFKGEVEVKRVVREWSYAHSLDLVPYIDHELPPIPLFGDIQRV